MRVPPSKEM